MCKSLGVKTKMPVTLLVTGVYLLQTVLLFYNFNCTGFTIIPCGQYMIRTG